MDIHYSSPRKSGNSRSLANRLWRRFVITDPHPTPNQLILIYLLIFLLQRKRILNNVLVRNDKQL